jgi:N-glycosylase/DNA lyase
MKTVKKNKPTDLQDYIAANYNVGLRHYKKTFLTDRTDSVEVFYLFVFCLLVPGGRATRTKEAVVMLRHGMDYLNRDYTRKELLETIHGYVRFPSQKVDRLIEFKIMWPVFSKWLFQAMEYKLSAVKVRENIVNNIQGFGYKAASHALRNLGYTNLAVIDTHILKYAKQWLPFAGEAVSYPGSKKRYLYMEDCFRRWSQTRFGLDPCILDWFIWCKESGNAVTALDC